MTDLTPKQQQEENEKERKNAVKLAEINSKTNWEVTIITVLITGFFSWVGSCISYSSNIKELKENIESKIQESESNLNKSLQEYSFNIIRDGSLSEKERIYQLARFISINRYADKLSKKPDPVEMSKGAIDTVNTSIARIFAHKPIYEIVGIVRDSHRKLIADANVSITSNTGNILNVCTTDKDGKYSLIFFLKEEVDTLLTLRAKKEDYGGLNQEFITPSKDLQAGGVNIFPITIYKPD